MIAVHAMITLSALGILWRVVTAINIINRVTCHRIRVAYVMLGGASMALGVSPWWPNNDLGSWVYLVFSAAVLFFLCVDRRRPRPAAAPPR